MFLAHTHKKFPMLLRNTLKLYEWLLLLFLLLWRSTLCVSQSHCIYISGAFLFISFLTLIGAVKHIEIVSKHLHSTLECL